MTVRLLLGDCRDVLKTLADRSVQCVVTSPPYFGLRDYGVEGQIGLEPKPSAFVAEMVGVFREVWRVLRDDGTVWLNLGDSYANDAKWGGSSNSKNADNTNGGEGFRQKRLTGMKSKDLMGIPWRVAFALQDDGWYLRRDIIWSKPNPMPESCTDRPSTAHEYVFLLTKRARYFYDAEAVREPMVAASIARLSQDVENQAGSLRANGGAKTNGPMRAVARASDKQRGHSRRHAGFNDRWDAMEKDDQCAGGRNLRSVWTIATQPFSEAHFATFPPKLAETCILAGTSEMGACPACGAPWARTITKGEPDEAHRAACGADASGGYGGQSIKNHDAAGVQNASDVKRRILDGLRKKTYGWQPTCDCPAADPVPCVVLDPFGGAGTVGLVAERLQRDSVLIELNPEYRDITERRITRDAGLFARVERG